MIAAFRSVANRSTARNPRLSLLRQTALAGGVLAAMVVFEPIKAAAQDRVWTGAVSAHATSSANWQSGIVPGNAASVVVSNYLNSPPTITGTINWRTLLIDLPNTGVLGQHTVTFSNVAGQTTSIAQPGSPIYITVRNGALDIANSAVTINSAQLVSGSSGSITTEAGGTVYNRGTVSVQVNNGGSFTNYDGGSIRAGIVNTAGAADANGDPITLVGFIGDKAGFINAGTLDCRPTICVGVAGQSTRTVQNSGYFQNLNTGVIMEGLYTSAGYVENLGTINHSTAVAGGIFANGRRYTVVDGGGTVTAEEYVSGTVANLSVTGGEFRNVSGSVTGTVTNSATIRNSGTFSGPVSNGGTFNNIVQTTLLATGGADKVGSVTGTLTNSGTLTNAGAISTLIVSAGTVENRLGGTIGSFTSNGGTTTNFGSITNPNVASGALINKSGGTINGIGIGIGQSGVFTNEAGGTVNGTVSSSGADLSGRVNANLGRITGNLTVDAGTFTQAGTLDGAVFVNGGTLIFGGQVGETFSDGNLAANLRGTGSTVQNNGRIAFNGGVDTVTVASVIQGSGIVEQRGNNGHTILTGNNTYTGKTIVSGGRLQISGTSVSNDFEVNGNGSLTLNRDTNTSFTGTVTGTGNFFKGGTGTMTLDSHLQNTGTVGVITGTLSIGSGSIAAAAKIATGTGATFDLGSAARTVGGITGQAGTISGTGTITVNTATGSVSQFSGVISGAGRALVKTGAGQQELYGANSFDGGVTINGGVLKVGSEAALGPGTTTIAVATGASLGLGNLATTPIVNFDFGKVITGAGGLIKTSGNTVTLTAVNTYTGDTVVKEGTLKIGATGSIALASRIIVESGAKFDIGRAEFTVSTLAGTSGELIGGGGTLTLNFTTAETFSGRISDGLGADEKFKLAVTGGAVTLTGDNSFTGGITISGHNTELIIGHVNAAGGAGNTILTRGTIITYTSDSNTPITVGSDTTQLNVAGAGSFSQLQPIGQDQAGRPIEKIGTGTLTFAAASTYSGLTKVSAGTLIQGIAGAIPADTPVEIAAGATLNTGAFATALSGLTGAGTLTGTGAVTVTTAASQTFSGVIAGTGLSLTKAGTTTLILSGDNTYTGTTTISAGTLQIGDGGGTGSLGAGPVTNNGTLAFNRDSSAAVSVTQAISGTGALEKLGTGTVTLLGLNTYSGATTISAGTLSVGTSMGVSATQQLGADTASNILRFNGGRLSVTGMAAETFARPVEITANGGEIANAFAAPLTLTGATTFTGLLTKTGAGSLILNGAGTGAGGLTVTAGTLQLGNNAALGTGTLRFAGAGLTLVAGATTVSSANAIILDNIVSFDTLANTLTLSGAISGAGGITKSNSGTLNLTGANSFTGSLAHNGGTLGIGSNTALGTAQATLAAGTTVVALADVRLANAIELKPRAGTLTASPIVNTNGRTVTIDGVISAVVPSFSEQIVSGLTKTGAGTLVLNGVNTYTGPTVVSAGTLVVNGSIAASSGITIAQGATLGGNGGTPTLTVQGTISPGNSVGILNINGGLTLASTATTVIEIEGANADLINVAGNATLAGALQLVAAGGSYSFARPYTILSATGTRSGTFATISTVGSFGVGVTSAVSYGASNVQVTLTAAPLVTPAPATTTTNAAGATTVLAQQAPVLGLTQTRNITAVASALDRAAFSGSDVSSLFRIYNQPTREALAAAINTLSGEVHTATTATGLRASDQFLRVMLDPFAIGRDGSLVGRSGSSGFTADLPGRKGPVAAPAPIRIEPTFHVWGASFGQIDRTRGDTVGAGSATREVKDANIAAGADYRIAPGSVIGFALSGGQSRAELGRNLGTNTTDIFQLGLYGATRLGALDLAASLSYAAMQVETRRSVPALGLNAAADYSAHVWGGRLQAAYDLFSAGGFTVSPIAALQVQSVHTPNFRETSIATGAAAGVIGRSHTNTALRSDLGLRLTSQTALGGRRVTLFTEIAWAHYYQRDITFAAGIAGVANTNFVIEGARANRDAALFSAGADIQLTPNLTLGGRFDASASGNTRSYAGTGALRASF